MRLQWLLQTIKWVATVSIDLLLLVFIGLLAYRLYLKTSTKIKTNNGISLLEEIALGGLKQ